MLLRRVIGHVKAQNWTAIALDFLIVVVGVFIGIQVSNWNDAQATRADEARLLSQLHDDVESAIESKRLWIEDVRTRSAQLASAIEVIQDRQGVEAMTQAQCNVVSQSHIFVPATSQLTTLDEILSTRGLDSLSGLPLRRELLAYRNSIEDLSEVYVFISEGLESIVDEFAETMPRRLDLGAGTTNAACRLDLMRDNITLQNRLIGNYVRANGIASTAEQELALLEAVQAALVAPVPL